MQNAECGKGAGLEVFNGKRKQTAFLKTCVSIKEEMAEAGTEREVR